MLKEKEILFLLSCKANSALEIYDMMRRSVNCLALVTKNGQNRTCFTIN